MVERSAECDRRQGWEQISLRPAAGWGKRASAGLALLGESFEMALHLFLSHILATPHETLCGSDSVRRAREA